MSKYVNRGVCVTMGNNCKVNGVTINSSCSNVVVSNGKVWIDGKEYKGENGELENKEVVHLTINVEGDLRKGVESDCDLDVHVKGSVIGNINSGRDTYIEGGNVDGNIHSGRDTDITGNQRGKVYSGRDTEIGSKVYE